MKKKNRNNRFRKPTNQPTQNMGVAVVNHGVATKSRSLQERIDSLYKNQDVASKWNELNKVLNHDPRKEWLRNHPIAKKKVPQLIDGQPVMKADGTGYVLTDAPVQYIPIGTMEYIATTIFTKWRVEVKTIQLIANSVVVSVRVHFVDPITAEWDYQDGIGAAPIRTDKGKAATDFGFVQDSAVQTASPAAESYAVKDALEKLGKIFGRDINRADEMSYHEALEKKFAEKVEVDDALRLVIAITETPEKLTELWEKNPEVQSNPEFMKLINERRLELKNEAKNANKEKQNSEPLKTETNGTV